MKRILTFLLAITSVLATAQSKQKFDVIVGIHSGICGSLYQYGNYYHLGVYGGDKFGIEGLSGLAIPVNTEILFDVYGFRSGIRLEYNPSIYFQEASFLHSGNIMACIEYGFKVNPKLTIAPSFCAGGTGATYRDDGGYGMAASEVGYAFKGSLHFEIGAKRAKFTISPTYSYSKIKGGGFNPSKSQLHMYGLNMGVRFHLLRPKTEGK